jgi:hypothetical protein
MKICSCCRIKKPLALFHPKKGGRFGVDGSCKDCVNARSKRWRQNNAGYVKAHRRAFAENNREILAERSRRDYRENRSARRATQKRYYEENKEAISARNAVWREANYEYLQAYDRKRSAHKYLANLLHRLNNPEKCRAYMAEYARLRNANLRHAQPAWADRRAIRTIYLLCQQISEETGIAHHVDHIVPLKGKYVCGLHVETNLQILTASDNMKKSNSFAVG